MHMSFSRFEAILENFRNHAVCLAARRNSCSLTPQRIDRRAPRNVDFTHWRRLATGRNNVGLSRASHDGTGSRTASRLYEGNYDRQVARTSIQPHDSRRGDLRSVGVERSGDRSTTGSAISLVAASVGTARWSQDRWELPHRPGHPRKDRTRP